MDQFEAGFRLIVDPNQWMSYTAFIKGLMHDLDIHIHLILSNLVASHVEKYEDAHKAYNNFLKLKAKHEKSISSKCKCATKKEEHKVKQPCQERKTVPLELDLPLLTYEISYIY